MGIVVITQAIGEIGYIVLCRIFNDGFGVIIAQNGRVLLWINSQVLFKSPLKSFAGCIGVLLYISHIHGSRMCLHQSNCIFDGIDPVMELGF